MRSLTRPRRLPSEGGARRTGPTVASRRAPGRRAGRCGRRGTSSG